MNRGHVPEWDDTYIERYIPQDIRDKMNNIDRWVDDEGFWWGYGYVSATKIRSSSQPVVIMASKPLGQGFHIAKTISVAGTIKEYMSTELL